jgi:hypothetical protein
MTKERRIRVTAYVERIGEIAHIVLVRKSEEYGALGRSRHRWRVILK